SQARTLTAAIIPPTPITRTGTIQRTAIATGQPITAMPLRPGRMSAAGAGGMGTAIACAERPPPVPADRTLARALRARRSAGLFFPQKNCRPVPGLTKSRKITGHDRQRLNIGDGSVGGIRIIANFGTALGDRRR